MCDSSSLEAIKNSQHCLHELFVEQMKPDNIKQLLNIHNGCGTPSQVLMKIVQFYEGLNIEALVEKVPGFPELQGKLIPSVMACLGSGYGLTPLYRFVRNQSFLMEGRKMP